MTASLTGTPTAVTWAAGADPAGQSITIPSGTTAVYFFWSYFHATAGHGLASVTLNSVNPDQTFEIATANTTDTATGVAVWYNPSTGSQTLNPAWDAAPAEGPTTIVVYVRGGDTTAWRDADADAAANTTAVTVTLTTAAKDLVLKYDQRFGTAPVASTNWSAPAATMTNGGEGARLTYRQATGSTVVCDSEGENYSTVCAVSIPSALGIPMIEPDDCTVSGNNTAQATWAVSHPAASTGDLLIFNVGWDDSTNVTSVTAPSGPNGETLTSIEGPIASNGDEVRCQAWYTVATGSWTASTVTFTPAASESWTATVIKVPAGEFDATTPIGANSSVASTTTTDATVDSPAFTAGASDGGGRLVWFATVDADPLSTTPPTGCVVLQTQDLGLAAHGVSMRLNPVGDSESIAAITDWAIAGDSWCSIAYVVREAGLTAYSMTAAQGSYTYTGQAQTFRRGRPMPAAQGSYSLTGQAQLFVRGRPMTAAQGSYALNGQTVVLRAARRVTAAQGSYSLTGQVTGLKKGYPMVATQGSYALNGQTLVLRVARRMPAAQGSYSLTGQAQTLKVIRPMTAVQGSYTYTGQATGLIYTPGAKILTAAQGSYSLSGQVVRLAAGRRTAAAQGSYTLNGQALTFVHGRYLPAAQGSYSLTGQTQLFTRGRPVLVVQGSYTLNGQAVTLTGSGPVAPVEWGIFDDSAAILVQTLLSPTGREWVDYIPVSIVTDFVGKQWRTDDLGFIPVVEE